MTFARSGRSGAAALAVHDALTIDPPGVRPGLRASARVVRSVELLARLTELGDDAPGRRRIADFVATHLSAPR